MKTNLFKLAVITVFALTVTALTGFKMTPTSALAMQEDTATVYKTKCGSCHGQKAEKAYDPEKAMTEQVDIIMKGKKAEKPPNMPGYEAKGMTTEQATALAEYMKQLRTAPPK